ncbi:MAG: TetR/AcrR family transcriptional regulator [Pseudomonadota bacterium]
MDTRISLLESAERAVRERGYNGFSYADLAREIGIRKASIHYHFPTKANLGSAMIERYSARFFGSLADIAETGQSAADQLRAYIQVYRDALATGTQVCLCVSLSASRDSLSSEMLDRLNRFHEDSVAWLTQLFDRAAQDKSIANLAPADREANAALALVEGAQLLARARKDVAPFDQALATLTARLASPPLH